jgi:hypothetical protein
MRTDVVLCAGVMLACVLGGCSSHAPTSSFLNPDGAAGAAVVVANAAPPPSSGDASLVFGNAPSNADAGASAATNEASTGAGLLSGVHIVPADALLSVAAGSQGMQTYQVLATIDGAGPEVDVTPRFVFYVPDNYLVGGFPANGAPTFASRVPSAPTDPPQQGGKLTVQAQATNADNSLLTATTTLTVQLTATLTGPAGTGVPANAQALFGTSPDGGASDSGVADGSPSTVAPDPTRAPTVFYPNDGVMLPPNLKQLEVHWQPGSSRNTLYHVSFLSAAASIDYYVRCGGPTIASPGLTSGACALQLDPAGYGYLAQSNAGQGTVTLTVAGADDSGTGYGVSIPVHLQFAQESVNGGVYYWDVTHTRIMRFDFGGTQTAPEIFLAPGDYGTNGNCIGCHTLSPDGTKIAASQNGQFGGQLVYVDDIGKATSPPAPARSDPSYLTQNNDAQDHIQFASFDPAGDQFVAVYGDTDSTTVGPDGGAVLDRNKLWFHDGTSGAIIPGAEKLLSFEPDHPCWSPDGTMIAMTHVGSHGTSQREFSGGIDVASFSSGVLGDPVVVVPSLVPGTNSYNPSFAPDSSFFVFSRTTCPIGQETSDTCDSDVANNLDTTTWAATPTAAANAIHLDNAGGGGLADKGTIPIDTFPRSTPFKTAEGSGVLFWFTVASQRQPGLRQKTGSTQQLLWMFAVDPAKILNGQDGSFPAFFLPFQDMSTSNHIAEWTQKIVSAVPPPPPPSPPPPPPPPAPPPAVAR